MINSNLDSEAFVPIMGALFEKPHHEEETKLAPAPITPHMPNAEEFLAHCHRRKYPAKSTIIYAGDEGIPSPTSSRVLSLS